MNQKSGLAGPNNQTLARAIHAWLLRAEGLNNIEVGKHFGVSGECASQMIATAQRYARRASRLARWSIYYFSPQEYKLLTDAAAEIERLQMWGATAVERMQGMEKEIERLRAGVLGYEHQCELGMQEIERLRTLCDAQQRTIKGLIR